MSNPYFLGGGEKVSVWEGGKMCGGKGERAVGGMEVQLVIREVISEKL